MPLTSDQWRELRKVFAKGAPVMVLGPGCHRVGFDDDAAPGWDVVQRRAAAVYDGLADSDDPSQPSPEQRFFLRLWASHLSDEARAHAPEAFADPVGKDLPHDPRHADGSDGADDPGRRALAVALLRALAASTRALGEVVTRGDAPVITWQEVHDPSALDPRPTAQSRHPSPSATILEEPRPSLATGESDEPNRPIPRPTIDAAADLAAALATAGGPDASPRERQTLEDAGLHGYKRWGRSDLLRIEAIASALRELATGHVPLSGNVVEWMSDLVWHVLISDSAIPLSQHDLAFFLNLYTPAEADPPVSFTRARPGDYRRADKRGVKLTQSLRDLLDASDAGAREPDWATPRAQFSVAIAASLVESWRQRPSTNWLTLALVSDYDVTLERSILEVLDEGEGFHVVVPVWVVPVNDADDAQLDWLFGTYIKRKVSISEREVLCPGRWEWLVDQTASAERKPPSARGQRHQRRMDDDDPAQPPLVGPIVFKLNGSPLHQIDYDEVPSSNDSKGFAGSLDDDFDLEIATIYAEYDSMKAIVSLFDLVDQSGPLPTLMRQLFADREGLAWDARAWLFFGHRFSDWLPRLRLFFSATTLRASARQSRREVKERIPAQLCRRYAIDRRFDWPERALLRVLDVEHLTEDLANVARYYNGRHDDRAVRAFLERVDRMVVSVRGR